LGCALQLGAPVACPGRSAEPVALARVEVVGPLTAFNLPVNAVLQDASGRDYLLVLAETSRLDQAGWPYRVLESPAQPGACLIAHEMRPGARAALAGRLPVLHDDGTQVLLRAAPSQSEALAEAGFAIRWLNTEPLVLSQPTPAVPQVAAFAPAGASWRPDPLVAGMIPRVQQAELFRLTAQLTGVDPVVVEGRVARVATRHTASGPGLLSASRFAYERMQALGLAVRYQTWSASTFSGQNIIGTQPGGALSNEIVCVTAHLDNMPPGAVAPGADDNASGSAAVLMAAGIFRQFHFARTVRFVLFTGEEQGLLGSKAYAAEVYAAGENVVAVLNLDMIGWDSAGAPVARLFTRTPTSPGYSNDLAIAATFTNVVAAYGLSDSLAPVIQASGMGASDHASFWDKGFPAILAIEDYPADFCAFYHTTNDTLATLNLSYFTAFTRVAVGTLAHLALPAGRVARDVVEVAASDWTPGSSIGVDVFHARHEPEAAEALDPWDTAWAGAPTNSAPLWLRVATAPEGAELKTDTRPASSETLFRGTLSAGDTTGAGFTTTCRLRWGFLTPPEPGRIYTLRVQLSAQQTEPPVEFLCVTNLRDLVASGGYLDLPPLGPLTNGAVFGSWDLAARFLDTNAAGVTVGLPVLDAATVTLTSAVQVGAPVVDDVEVAAILGPGLDWSRATSFTNVVAPDVSNFESGWQEVSRPVEVLSLPTAPAHYFRLKRVWLPPGP
jgi:hypothetical protein